jgi:hypothetical protein
VIIAAHGCELQIRDDGFSWVPTVTSLAFIAPPFTGSTITAKASIDRFDLNQPPGARLK